MMRKWDAMCSSLPQLVSRLQSLKDLHEQGKTIWAIFSVLLISILFAIFAALQFSQSITYIDGIQQELSKTLDLNVNVLKEVSDASLCKNKEYFKQDCSLEIIFGRYESSERLRYLHYA